MFARSRVLAAVACTVGVVVGMLVPSTVVTADPAKAPKVCTAAEEKAADGDQEAVDACHKKRLASAQARFDNVPNAKKLRDRTPYEIEGTMGVTGTERKSEFDSPADAYAALASEVVYIHCFALVEHGEACAFPVKTTTLPPFVNFRPAAPEVTAWSMTTINCPWCGRNSSPGLWLPTRRARI